MEKGKSPFFNSTVSSRIHRKTLRIATKPSSGKRVHIGKRISLGKNQKNFNASFPPTTSSSLCDNSNDSGLGFDHHESQHIIHQQHPINGGNLQTMTLTTDANNVSTNANYQRSMNTIRYGEISQANYAPTTTSPTSPTSSSSSSFVRQNSESSKNKHCIQLGAGKKIKSVIKKPFMPVKNTNHLTLKNETEDTCGDDFFSTHVQKNKLNNTISSPTNLTYSSATSPSERNSSSSSPTTSSNRSSPEITNNLQLSTNLASESSESLEAVHSTSPSLLSSLQNQNHSAVSSDGKIQLQIITQPEQQHRARYQTEGSRGAVKDKSGNGFPVVKLNGYSKPAILQVFIGNDVGKVSPHIFYQACKVSGKNSTPCNEAKVDGTMVIEIEIKPENDMTVICDCVGILKERNVDVEHRLGKNNTITATVTRNKKKSTKCRMIFRTKINEDTEYSEVLQICSNTITCTQPPGVPEICKKSLDSYSCRGGKELFIIGKNFLKDTKVTFTRYDENGRQMKKIWEETVFPDKEYLQQTHLICRIPAYPEEITEPVQVQIYVTSSNKKSEPHTFIYIPFKHYRSPSIDGLNNIGFSTINQQDLSPTSTTNPHVLSLAWNEPQGSSPENIMPPPISRKPSFSKSLSEISTNDTKINSPNELQQQETTTSSPTTIQPIQQASVVKEMIYSDSTMLDVTRQCFLNPSTASNLMNSTQVGQTLLEHDFQVVHHIKSEQNQDQLQNVATNDIMPPPSQQPSQASELNSVQQQQVVENFINMICAQVEPTIVQQNTDNIISHHHLNQDLMMNQATNNVVVGQTNNDHASMMSAISTQPMICEQNIMSVQLSDGTNIIPLNTLDASINNDTASNTTLISNAVSEAAAETQAVVKQMIANVAAEILSENPNETQSSINNFISSTLGGPESTQQQTPITSSQQQLQEIIAQELMTPVMIKKEENDGQPQNVQHALISDSTSNNPSSSNMTQPFSPTPADFNLTSMSESDLISFINPSVFI
ncbi:nuclear factor of activated T-cells 5-like isoform X2 [Chironomus tepperi]|uniref:nuclear factor of activated T-cells 5-like isoform X2 n=1 Tax=Chironomus tepperi TaxID=113505 RepID=UPI00391FA09C